MSVRDLRVRNGDVELAGTLYLPTKALPHATLLMVGGSGPTDRDNDVYFPPIRARLLDAGVAVASFDKRGVGGSTGDWHDGGPAELTADALAELAHLRNEAGIDPRAIGAIQITDRFSLVELPDDIADDVIGTLRATTIKGRKVPVRRDREHGA